MNKLRTIALQCFILLVPLWYVPGLTRDLQEKYYQYGAIILVAAFCGNMWLGAFLGLNLFLFLYNGGHVGLSQVMNVMFGVIIFAFTRYFFSKNKFEIVNKPILIMTCITLVFMMLQLFQIDPIFIPLLNDGSRMYTPLGDPVGFFGIKEANGTFLTIVMPILASVNPILGLLLLIPIKLCQSSTVYLAAMVVVLFYSFYLHKKFFKFLFIVIPIAAIFIIGDIHTDPMTFYSRFPVWHATISKALKFPIGYGPDSFRNFNSHKDFQFISDSKYNLGIGKRINDTESNFNYYSVSNDIREVRKYEERLRTDGVKKDEMAMWDNPHNGYINVLFQYGILGFILMCGLLYEMFKRFKNTIKDKELIVITSCILVYIVTSFGHFPLEIARTAFFFPILLGAFYQKTDDIT